MEGDTAAKLPSVITKWIERTLTPTERILAGPFASKVYVGTAARWMSELQGALYIAVDRARKAVFLRLYDVVSAADTAIAKAEFELYFELR